MTFKMTHRRSLIKKKNDATCTMKYIQNLRLLVPGYQNIEAFNFKDINKC